MFLKPIRKNQFSSISMNFLCNVGVIINFMCWLDWAKGCPCTRQSSISGWLWGYLWKRLALESVTEERRWPHHCRWAPSHPPRAWAEQTGRWRVSLLSAWAGTSSFPHPQTSSMILVLGPSVLDQNLLYCPPFGLRFTQQAPWFPGLHPQTELLHWLSSVSSSQTADVGTLHQHNHMSQ